MNSQPASSSSPIARRLRDRLTHRSLPGSGGRRRFLDWSGPAETGVDVGVGRIDLPIRYWRTDCFMGLFGADESAVRALFPTPRLQPVRVSPGRAVVAVAAFNYLETGVGPYGEIAVSPLCTFDRAAPPMLPLATGAVGGMSGFVAHLPVTSRIAREAGRRVWGYPKFVADMDFDLAPEHQAVTLSEDGRDILRLSVPIGGAVRLERTPLTTYTVREGRLIRTRVEMHGHVATSVGRHAGGLELGDHPLGRELSGLGLSERALAGRTYLTHHAVLPIGTDLGPSAHPYAGYAGLDREFGRHTVRYDTGVRRVVTEASRPEAAVTGAVR